MQKIIDLYLTDLEIQGKSNGTIQSYRRHLQCFRGFYETCENKTPPHLIIHEWLKSSDVAPQTKASRWRTVRAFWRWAADAGYLQPMSPRYKPRFEPGEIRLVPPRAEVVALLESIPKKLKVDRRDRALFMFIYYTGCRASEASSMRARDVDLKAGRAQIYGAKTHQRRIVPLVPALQKELSAWIGHLEGPDAWLFPSARRGGKPIDRFRIYDRWIKRQGERVEKMSVHDLRRAFATHALSAGVDSLHVQAVLGHASVETTAIYAKSDVSAARDLLGRALSPD